MLTHKKRGAALLSIWLFLACGLIAFFLPLGSGLLRLACCLGAAALSYPLFFLRLASARATADGKELCVTRGVLFLRKKRLSLRYLTGLSIWRTPLQRLFGLCSLAVYASGSAVVLFCVDAQQGAQLYALLQKGGAAS
ncbi:MAG: PH domain-containing protein [Oscillospiraceae bacterium]|nr:PH domain-containing protein [Oscillospiraceae bacterium]